MTIVTIDENLSMQIVSPFRTEETYALINTNREYLRTFLGWVDSTNSKDDTYAFIKGSLKNYAEKKEIQYHVLWNEKIIGTIGIWVSNEETVVYEIGYWIAKEYSGKGIITKCVDRLLHIGFKYLNAEKIEISCAVENIASNRIAQKLNMKLEGLKRKAEKVNNKIYDHNIYGILREEYKTIA